MSADTIVPRPGDPHSLNQYSYVLNRPLNYIDPTGHAQQNPDSGGVGCLTKAKCVDRKGDRATDRIFRTWAFSGGNNPALEEAFYEHHQGENQSAAEAAGVADGVTQVMNSVVQNSAGGAGARNEVKAMTNASKVETQGVIAGNGSVTRKVNFRPSVSDPKWGLRPFHLNKHLFGSGKHSLQKIDSAGNADLWVGYLQDLAGRPATNSHASGIFDVIGTFEKADGSGSFQL
jgi:hypothetical protein